MNLISVSGHDLYSLRDGVSVIEFNTECALGKFAVVVDTDILDAHIVHGQQ